MTQHGKITYHQQVTYCGKPRCRRCREGIGHGPYWYAYQTINGQTTRSYIGKGLPPAVQAGLDTTSVASGESFMAVNFSTFSSRSTHLSSAVEAENVVLRISTLGQFRLEQRAPARSKQKSRDGWRVVDTAAWQQRSVRILLAYLICSPDRRVNRSQVLVALWPNDDLATANSALNKTLNALRKVLGHPSVKSGEEHQIDSGERFTTDGDWLLLSGQQHVWIDVDEFEFLAQQIEEQGSQLPQYEDVLQRAIELYNGDFLPEERSAEWAISLRQRLRHKWIELLLKLSTLYVTRKNHTGAINVLNNLLAKDPTNEQAIQQLIVVLMHQKRRIEAIQAYQRFEKTLQRDYKATPPAEMRALYDAVCSGEGLPAIDTLTDDYALSHPSGDDSSRVAATSQKAEHGSRAHHLFVPRAPSESVGRRHQGALIGREAELGMMRAMLQDVERNAHLQLVGARRTSGMPLDTQRQPQLLLLRGDIGIGKTRLVEELGSATQHEGWNIIWNRIYQQESGIPYRVWIEALRKILSTVPGLISQLNIETLRALSTLPGLLDLLPSGIDSSLTPALLLPEQAKYMLYNAICDLLKQASENGPLLIVLDDIQWADVSSYELLGHLARQLTGYTIVFFATCRVIKGTIDTPKPLRTLILEMQREHTIKTLDIEPLSSEQIKLLVTDISNLPEDMVAHIQVHAAGNPFFAEQLARSTPPAMPVTIKEALRYRMNQLRAECQDLLSRAAVLGGSFELPILCAMETNSETDVSETVISLLDEAIDAGVLMDEGNGTRITYHFWHPLLDNYLYEDKLSARRRGLLHQRAADAIVSTNQGREEEVAATVTMHLEKAGAEPTRIAYYAELAGNSAYIVSAYAEATLHYRKAVNYLEQKLSPDQLPPLISLLERLAECTMNSGGNYKEARDIFQRVLDLRRNHQLPLADQKSEAQIQALLWEQMSWTWRYVPDIPRAWECWSQGEALLRAAGVVGGPVWARLYYTQSNLYQCEGSYVQALESAQQAISLIDAEQTPLPAPISAGQKICKTLFQRIIEGYPDLYGRLQRHMGSIAVAMGQLSQALAYQNLALKFFEQYTELRQIAHVSCNIGYIHLKMAEYSQAQAALRRALHLAESIGDRPLISLVQSNLGELEAAVGNLDEAEAQYTSALKLNSLLNDREYMSKWNSGLAGVLLEQGKVQKAAKCMEQAFFVARSIQNAPCIGQALVALGNIRITQALDAAMPAYKRALLLAHAQQDIERALRLGVEAETRMKGALALAHIAYLRGEQHDARTAFEQVIVEALSSEHLQIVARARQLLARV